MIIMFAALGVQVFFHWVFVEDFGLKGVAYSLIIVQFFMFISLTVYTKCLKQIKPQNPFTVEAIKDAVSCNKMKDYLKIGVPAALFLECEWGSFMCLILISGYIPD